MKKVINIIALVGITVLSGALMWALSMMPSYDALPSGWKLGFVAMSGWLYSNSGWTTPAALFIAVFALVLTILIMREVDSELS